MFLAVDAAMTVPSGALVLIWERWLGPQRFGRKLEQLQRAGLVERVAHGSSLERVVRLTEAGKLAACGGRDPEKLWNRRWDGRWRMVLFDVQEAKRVNRTRLQRQLRRLSFGYLQDSVWISPDPADTLQASLGNLSVDAATLTLLEARPCGGESDADLVRGAWDFARINRNYDIYLEILRGGSTAMGERVRRNWLQVEWKAWCDALRHDPLLPVALLPRSYRGREAWERRREKAGRWLIDR